MWSITENIEDGVETCHQDDEEGIEEPPDEDHKGDEVTNEATPEHEETLGKICQIMTQEEDPPPQPPADPKLPEMANLFEFLPKPSSVPGGGCYPGGARRPSNAVPLPTDHQMTTHVWTPPKQSNFLFTIPLPHFLSR